MEMGKKFAGEQAGSSDRRLASHLQNSLCEPGQQSRKNTTVEHAARVFLHHPNKTFAACRTFSDTHSEAMRKGGVKARRASKGCFLLGCEDTLARASGSEIHPCWRVGL
jgi:hypothetical protein